MKNNVPVSWIAALSAVLIFVGGCASDQLQNQVLQVTKTSDAANNWLRIQVDPSLAPDVA